MDEPKGRTCIARLRPTSGPPTSTVPQLRAVEVFSPLRSYLYARGIEKPVAYDPAGLSILRRATAAMACWYTSYMPSVPANVISRLVIRPLRRL